MFVKTENLTDEQKKQVAEMTGKIVVWMIEGKSLTDMSLQLNLSPYEVMQNILETLYTIRKRIGWKNYFKVLFRK